MPAPPRTAAPATAAACASGRPRPVNGRLPAVPAPPPLTTVDPATGACPDEGGDPAPFGAPGPVPAGGRDTVVPSTAVSGAVVVTAGSGPLPAAPGGASGLLVLVEGDSLPAEVPLPPGPWPSTEPGVDPPDWPGVPAPEPPGGVEPEPGLPDDGGGEPTASARSSVVTAGADQTADVAPRSNAPRSTARRELPGWGTVTGQRYVERSRHVGSRRVLFAQPVNARARAADVTWGRRRRRPWASPTSNARSSGTAAK